MEATDATKSDARADAFNADPTMASSDRFRITIRGKKVHGAYPPEGIDAVVVAAECVTALCEPSIISTDMPRSKWGVHQEMEKLTCPDSRIASMTHNSRKAMTFLSFLVPVGFADFIRRNRTGGATAFGLQRVARESARVPRHQSAIC